MIKVYVSNSCPYCTRAKSYLDSLGFEYESLNIQQDNKARDFFVKGGFRTVPQVFFNDKLLCEGGSDGLAQMSKEQIQGRIKQLDN
jgi:glutaredoxin